MDLSKLKAPFPAEDIEWRVAQCGKTQAGKVWAQVLAYVTARAVMDRLDEVCGPENWRAEYENWGTGVLCRLSIRIGADWITKQDGAENTEFEPFKGGISGALKRAASAWGIGRYLYNLDTGWANVCDRGTKGARHTNDKQKGVEFYWTPPSLPDWALPAKEEKPKEPARAQPKEPTAFEQCPTQVPVKAEPGEFVITQSKKYKGKRLKDVPRDDLIVFAQVSMKWFIDNKKEPSDEWKELFAAIDEYTKA